MRLIEMIVSSISFIGDAQFSAFETIDQFVFQSESRNCALTDFSDSKADFRTAKFWFSDGERTPI
jgi:hypothetical protein